MARLTVKDLIEKKDKCVGRFAIKTTLIHSDFLDGEIEFHSLSRAELLEAIDKIKIDSHTGLLQLIYVSCDDLSKTELLKAFKCDKFENYRIVERLFTEIEIQEVGDILGELNGITGKNPTAIYEVQAEEIKN